MSRFSTLVLVLLMVQGFVFPQIPELVADMGYADLILVNGKIVTMDDWSIVPNTPGTIVEAMAVKGKKIMALGGERQIRDLAGPATRFVDVGGKTVIPGLIQTHYHLFGPAASRFGPEVGLVDPSIKVTVVAEATAEGTSKKIRDSVVNAIEAQKIPEGQWISVSLREGPENRPSTNRTWLYRGLVNRRTVQLDTAAPDHPVVVGARQAGIFNAAAIRAFKQVFPDWEESTMLERGRSSAAQDGYAAVPELQGLTFAYWWKDEPIDKLAEALRLHGETLQKLGMTTVSTRLLFPSIV